MIGTHPLPYPIFAQAVQFGSHPGSIAVLMSPQGGVFKHRERAVPLGTWTAFAYVRKLSPAMVVWAATYRSLTTSGVR